MKQQIIVAGAVALAIGGSAAAQQVPDTGEATLLDRLLLTDGRTPVEQEKSGRAFTVITGEELEQRQVRYVADALRQVPGFSISRAGPLVQARVRGAEGNHLLVMIDGVEASETSSGEFDFGGLLVDNIERIEVLRGPQSAFWGSNALAGVVNIITKGGKRDGWELSGRSEAGTDGTALGGLTVRGGAETYDVALSAAFRRTDGFNISESGSEKDSERNATLNGKFNLDLSPDLKLDGTLRYVDRLNEYDPTDFSSRVVDGDNRSATREFSGSLGATWTALDGLLTQKARFAGSGNERDDDDGTNPIAATEGRRYTGSYQATLDFDTPSFADARHQITGGYEYELERFRAKPPVLNPSQLDLQERTLHGFVGEYRGEFFDQFYVNAALRRDLNDRFEDATTWSLSGAWAIPDSQTRLHASAGKGVTNPTFFEQFGFIPGSFTPNPDLVPESSLGWDIGVEQKFFDGDLVVDVTYFHQNLENEIVGTFGGGLSSVDNLDGTSRRQGVEVAATVNLFDGLTATASYTYTDSKQPDGEIEIRRPKHSGSLNATYTFMEGRANVFGEAVFNGKMQDNDFSSFPANRETLAAYTLVNIGGSYKFNDAVEAYARVENLLDEDYREVLGYKNAGRTAFIGVRGKF